MATVTYKIPSMHCHHCIHTIESELSELAGVREVKAELAKRQVTITFDAPATEEKIKTLLAEINYPVAE